jgi:excinuclease ABC subunit C
MNPHITELRKKAAALPLQPGVYMMKDKHGKIIYVGKSRKLKNRVSSYFVGEHNRKTERMVAQVADFDTILCDSEMEALSLENVLIKQHTPHYNIKLKDAKSYPYIKLTDGSYPRLLVTRDRGAGHGRYFGPYSGTSAAYAAADAVNRIFRLPTCRRVFPRDIGKERPCLYYQLGRCVAPCTGNVSEADYEKTVQSACAVLSGGVRDTVRLLEEEMLHYASNERFEDAARCRDSIAALNHLQEKQKVVADAHVEQDVFAVYADDTCGVLAMLTVREGKLCGKNEFVFSAAEIPDEESLSAFLYDFYRDGSKLPREVLLAFSLEEEEYETLSAVFSERAGRRVTLHTPQRGAKRSLCAMAEANAKEKAARYAADMVREDKTLISLCHLLGLEVLPERIEAYDISNLGAEHIKAAMVVYAEGGMKRSDYRTFSIKSTDGIDDYAATREALTRRLSHVGDGSPSLGTAPDLILLDGGRGHVHVGRAVLAELGLDIPIFGMVKDDFHKTRALTDGENEISIALDGGVFAMIYKIQEEVHRVAVRQTMGAKRKTLRRSKLEDIPGIGPARAKLLLSAFGGLSKLKRARQDDIAAVRGISAGDAASVYRYFHPEEEKES